MKRVHFLFLLAFLLVGCSPTSVEPGGSPIPALQDTQTSPSLALPSIPPPLATVPGAATPVTPALPTPYNADLQGMVDIAAANLAERLSIPVSDIRVVAAYAVTWSDSSLGCPQEGMSYAQVLTPGYLILLEHDSNRVEYHTDQGSYVVYCLNPSPPLTDSTDK